MIFICYPKCTTCQRAKKWLEENGYSFNSRDIKANPPTFDELKKYHELSGLDIKKFFNTSGLLYKSLNLKDKLQNLNLDDKLKLLSTDGMLVKRPILVVGNSVLVGFKAEQWSEIIKQSL